MTTEDRTKGEIAALLYGQCSSVRKSDFTEKAKDYLALEQRDLNMRTDQLNQAEILLRGLEQ